MKFNKKIFLIIIIIILLINSISVDNINIWILNKIIVSRGLITTNCNWFAISDIILSNNASGISIYNKFKREGNSFVETEMFGEKIYLVVNPKYVKPILEQSPDVFNVGNLKKKFFKTFMAKNVGVSSGCPWKKRRYLNEKVLFTDSIHIYSDTYNSYIKDALVLLKNTKKIQYNDLIHFGKNISNKVIFNADSINNDVFNIFSLANTEEVFYNPNFKIDSEVYRNYIKELNYYIDNPQPKSLIKLCVSLTKDKEEIIHQIPHFIFPIVSLFITTIPRLLLLLCNHPIVFKNVIDEIHQSKIKSYPRIEDTIHNLTYLKKCILETVRLNNPVTTTFRTLMKDYTFDEKYSFKKGDQFLILNNAVLRENIFNHPNKFIPSRWTKKLENSDYSISFSKGPQQCPGKDLAIYLIQSFIYNFILIKNIGVEQSITCNEIDNENIHQMFNPCKIEFTFNNICYKINN